MNKMISTMILTIFVLLFSSIAIASDKGKSADGPLSTERFKTDHGVVVRNTYDGIRHTCINSNPHSRASSRSEVCTFEMKVGGEWMAQDISTARDASIWRSLPNAVMNGTGAALVQGHFAVKAAEKMGCGDSCGTTINNSPAIGITTNTNVDVAGCGAPICNP